MEFSLYKTLKAAQEGHYAVGQFNYSVAEQMRAIMRTAASLHSPIILGASEKERQFLTLNVGRLKFTKLNVYEELKLLVFFNADHCKSFESAKQAVDLGFDAVHFDGSELPHEENIKITKQVIEYAKSKNPEIVVEGELGRVRGSSELHKEAIKLEESDFTDPNQAAEFVKETSIDSLAISFGNIHGMFGKELKGAEKLDIERLKVIHEKINAFLVLHGGSGISADEVKNAIKNGIVKVNINTELRIAFSQALRKFLQENPEENVPYKIFPPAMESVRKVVEEKIKLFGSENKL